MELSRKSLMDLIKQISNACDKFKFELELKNKQIEELKLLNVHLKESNLATLDQIKEYIKELEQIRNHYVDSNNKS